MVALLSLFLLFFSSLSFAIDDPTDGKAILPWLWEDQFKPTLVKSVDKTGLIFIGTSTALSLGIHIYDHKIGDYNQNNQIIFSEDDAKKLGKLGNGLLSLGIAATQYAFDQKNGLRHARALILTSMSHFGISSLVRRTRPNNRSDYLPHPASFPSGHASQAFATAGALAYSYGWKAGIPAYLVASSIAIARISEDRHWTSDVVAGALLGTFWARASFEADKDKENTVQIIPTPIYDGLMISAFKEF